MTEQNIGHPRIAMKALSDSELDGLSGGRVAKTIPYSDIQPARRLVSANPPDVIEEPQ